MTMNKFDFFITPLAKDGIIQTLNYIENNLGNLKATNDLYKKIENGIQQICLFPFAQNTCEEYLILDKNIRHLIIDNYILIYEIIEEKKQINILGFKYAKMNLLNLKI